MNELAGDFYNEDYYENGLALGCSGYSNYRWIPELTIPMAYHIINGLNISENSRILDYGCAKGYLVSAFKLLGFVEKREKNNWKNYSDSKKYIVNMNPNLNELQNDSISKNRFDYDIRIWDSDVQKGTLIQNKLSKITIPTLLIKPASSLIRNSQIEKLKNNYSNFSIEEISDSTHMVIFENPENITNLILKYTK